MLVLKDVHKTFNRGSANEKIALKGITLSVNEGDFITVIGGNGAGKSTMLNMISGAFPVDSGMIKIGGENVTNQPEHIRAKRIGRVFQDPMRGTAGRHVDRRESGHSRAQRQEKRPEMGSDERGERTL